MLRRILFSVFLMMLLATPVRAETLYDDLGRMQGIDNLTTALLDRAFADSRISFLFDPETRADLHVQIVEQVCMETGGPCEYLGLSMLDAHSGMQIKHSEFDAFVEDLILAMEDVDIPYRTQNRLLKIFAPMRSDIVYK